MTSGLLDVIEKYVYGYPNLNSKLTSEMKIFKNVEQDFERYFAIHERSIIMPGRSRMRSSVLVGDDVSGWLVTAGAVVSNLLDWLRF
ncbi:hypothetical protein AHAS_Ahas12G0119100 [Arachis hypogaea]